VRIGDLIADRYELEELVGEGGMSKVFRAHDAVLDRLVAIKVLHDRYSRDPEYVERFRREARAIARLAHPNIVTVIDRGEWEGCQYIVFEHVAGEDLKSIVARVGALPVDRALRFSHQVARALAFAHGLGIVHRDVKPHNVLVDLGGTAKVTDFGIARTADTDDGLTTTGTVLGTGYYLSPEQASGERGDERSDQYSFGVLMYELLTGHLPYEGENLMAIAMRHVSEPVPSVRAERPEVPPRVDAIVARAMAKRPDERFPTMDALVGALEAAHTDVQDQDGPSAETEATGVLPVATPPRPLPPPRAVVRPRRRRLPGWILAVLVLVAAGVAGALFGLQVVDDDGVPLIGGGSGVQVNVSGIGTFDPPPGDGQEHTEDVGRATDGNEATFWTTEHYVSFDKPGVGLVLEAGGAVELSRLLVTSDEPGFTAEIRAGDGPQGPFAPVSDKQEVGERTDFHLDLGGQVHRFYVIWITQPNASGLAHVNEVTAFRPS
jgi:eukaryotic-like serine/threonine-protein kinase